MSNNAGHEHHLHYHCHKGVTGEYIGYLFDLPGVMVHSSTKKGIKEELQKALAAYFNAFPEEHTRIANEIDTEKPVIEDLIIRD
jgi:predicted RNase H-like HicB family nuclease